MVVGVDLWGGWMVVGVDLWGSGWWLVLICGGVDGGWC